jgi:hypothetical protein
MFKPIVIALGVLALTQGVVADPPPAEKGLALVELFTSEGCSSCPPADRLLTSLHKTQPFSGVTIVSLAFHVEYWDNLGWKDPFGDKRNSLRQRAYAGLLKEKGVYTPQMVVNGVRGFVGSDRRRAQAALQESATRPAGRLTIKVDPKASGATRAIVVNGPIESGEGHVLWVAIAEDGLSSKVTRGENQGKMLSHQAVVRAFTRYDISSTEGSSEAYSAELPWSDKWNQKHCRVVAAVQSEKTGAILALGQLSLGASE